MQTVVTSIAGQYHLRLSINKENLFPVRIQNEIFQTTYQVATKEQQSSFQESWEYFEGADEILDRKLVLTPETKDETMCILDMLGDNLKLLAEAALMVARKFDPELKNIQELQELFWIELYSLDDDTGLYEEETDSFYDWVTNL